MSRKKFETIRYLFSLIDLKLVARDLDEDVKSNWKLEPTKEIDNIFKKIDDIVCHTS